MSVPEHVRNNKGDAGDVPAVTASADARVKAALETGKNYILEESGLDIVFNGDLLQSLSNYLGAELDHLGAGLFQGRCSDHIVLELLLNSTGNVGQVQLCITEAASEEEIRDALSNEAIRRHRRDTYDQSVPAYTSAPDYIWIQTACLIISSSWQMRSLRQTHDRSAFCFSDGQFPSRIDSHRET